MADSGNIWAATIGGDGACVYAAPLGTTLPTSATEALDDAFLELGLVSEEGFTVSIKRDTTKHYDFRGEPVKTTQDRYTETAKWALLESSENALGVAFGADNVTVNGDIMVVEHSPLMLERQSFVIDFIDGARVGRHVLREALVTELGDLKYLPKELVMYDITVDLYKTAAGLNPVVTYFDASPGS